MMHTLGDRYLLDLMYYLVVLIVLLNVVFGIIIDTFGDLRSKKEERERDINERCFICGTDKLTFDRSYDGPEGFKQHVKEEHNMWSYLYFIIRIWELDRDEDDGLELRVRKCLETNDISWFPMNKALCLNVEESSDDFSSGTLKSGVQKAENNISQELGKFQLELNYLIVQISGSIKKLEQFDVIADEKEEQDDVVSLLSADEIYPNHSYDKIEGVNVIS